MFTYEKNLNGYSEDHHREITYEINRTHLLLW